MQRDDATSSKTAMMVTEEGISFIGGRIEKPPVERDMDVVEAGEASLMAAKDPERRYPCPSWLQSRSGSVTRLGKDCGMRPWSH
jgi:hypothetical protein